MKKIVTIILLLSIGALYSQTEDININTSGSNKFEFSGKKYKTNYRGLEKFIEETTMSSQLRDELNQQAKGIHKKETISKVTKYAGMIGGIGLLFTQLDNDVEDVNYGVVAASFALFSSGYVVDWLYGPDENDYYKFFETFNHKNKKKPIEVSFIIGYQRQMNCGFAVSF